MTELGPRCTALCCYCCQDYWRGSVGCCGLYCCCGTPVTEKELEDRENEKKKQEKKLTNYWHLFRLGCFNFMKEWCAEPKQVKSYDYTKIYWDSEGNLRQGGSDRDRNDELLILLENDRADSTDPERIWVVMPSRWIREWLIFAEMKITSHHPGPVNIDSLVKKDDTATSGWRPLKTLRPPEKIVKKDSGDYSKIEYEVTPGHYRLVSPEVWRRFVKLYGVTEPGVVIAVKGNTEESPFSDMSRWVVFRDAMQQIRKSDLPDPVVVSAEEKSKVVRKNRRIFEAMGLS